MPEKTKVLFVCLGNICRSPSAEGIFQKKVNEAGLEGRFEIDSAGTAAYHIGKSPDPRSTYHAAQRGYDLSKQKARKVSFDDFLEQDIILAMDKSNYDDLLEIAPNDQKNKVKMILDHADPALLKKLNHGSNEVPDPYYEGDAGFRKVLDLLEDACAGLLKNLTKISS